jgi:hypothetical protein
VSTGQSGGHVTKPIKVTTHGGLTSAGKDGVGASLRAPDVRLEGVWGEHRREKMRPDARRGQRGGEERDLGFRVQGSRCRVQGVGCRVQG